MITTCSRLDLHDATEKYCQNALLVSQEKIIIMFDSIIIIIKRHVHSLIISIVIIATLNGACLRVRLPSLPNNQPAQKECN